MGRKSAGARSAISLPTGGGAVRGLGESFAPDPHTGTANFTVPIDLPPGRNGLQPQLALTYSSGSGNGPFGLGWSLGLPEVTRKTSAGIPRYDDERDTFVLSRAEDLVAVQTRPSGARIYRPRTEGLFARIEHHRDAARDYWEVRTKDGLLTRYGSAESGGGPDPAAVSHPDDPRRIFSWKACETTDLFGNRLRYRYRRGDVRRDGPHHWDQIYPSEVAYVDYGDPADPGFLVTVRFVYEPRPDAFSDYRAGFEVRTTERCSRIDVAVHAEGEEVVRSYLLDYVDRRIAEGELPVGDSPANRVSLLSRIRVEGRAGSAIESGPALELGYTRLDLARRDLVAVSGPDLPPQSLGQPDYELVDLFGCGLPAVVELGGAPRYWRNLGAGRLDRPRAMASAPAGLRLGDAGVQLADVNGDGRLDLLVSTTNLAGYFPLRFGGEWDARSFQRYREAPTFDVEDPEVRLVDLTGDGVMDAVRSGTSLECFFADAREGWTAANTRRVERRALEVFPDVNFSDPRVRWADMTGDGLQDVVLIADGRVEYWPSLGYGEWGARVSMARAPRLPFGYDPRRVLVGDVDGDGLADVVYVDDRSVTLWINQSGNGWSDPIQVTGTPPVSDVDAVRLTDFLGTGVSGVLWSADATQTGRARFFFLDFTGGRKPYLLDNMDGHLGSVTRIVYAPSTRFYLADEAHPQTRWISTLPFPVQVVASVETLDYVSGSKLTTEYRYHHGYWDGAEREFRGFARVDQLDTQVFADFHASDPSTGVGVSVPPDMFSPPLETRTWFHQGPVGEEFGAWQEADLSHEFWREDPPVLAPPEPDGPPVAELPGRDNRRDRRDATRTLRGRVLRTELYAHDGSPHQDRPYTVTEMRYGLREESPPAPGDRLRPRVFFPHVLASRTTQWERGREPMTRFEFAEDYDEYGQPRRQLRVGVPRGRDYRTPAAPGSPFLAHLTRTTYATDGDGAPAADRIARITDYEVVNDGSPPLDAVLESARQGSGLRPIGQTLHFYDGEPFTGLPAGRLGGRAALVRSEALVLTEDILRQAYGDARPAFLSGSWGTEHPEEFRAGLADLAGYVHRPAGADTDGVEGYYAATERLRYDFHEDSGGRGLVRAALDVQGHPTLIARDAFDLLPTTVSDAAGLTTHANYDYRVFRPAEVTDPNGNRTLFRFTPLGLLASVALLGAEGAAQGDSPDAPSTRYVYDLNAFAERGQPISVRTVRRLQHASSSDAPVAERERTIETIEYSDGHGRLVQTRTVAEYVTYGDASDNDGVLPAAQDDAATTRPLTPRRNDDAARPNVVVSGWQVYDNKGRVVEKHEPFFSTGWDYAPAGDAERGARARLYYDPRGHIVRTVNPDGSEQRVLFGVPSDLTRPEEFAPTPWEIYTYDADDNGGRTHPDTTRVSRHHWDTPASALLDALGRTVLSTERNRSLQADGTLSPLETYNVAFTYDLRGNRSSVTDPLGRLAFRWVHDLRPKRDAEEPGPRLRREEQEDGPRVLRRDELDGGQRRFAYDAGGHEVERRDERGGLALQSYDHLNRRVRVWARDADDAPVTLRERLEFGDGGSPEQPDPERAAQRALNRLGRLHRHYDEAGLLTFERYDFKGNITEKTRAVLADAHLLAAADEGRVRPVDWSTGTVPLEDHAAALLEDVRYTISSAYDALNRVRALRCPADVEGTRRELRMDYNPGGTLESISVDGAVFAHRIAHNARGQRTLVAYGNGVLARYAYDAYTFRLVRLRTEAYVPEPDGTLRPSGAAWQDVAYEYDLHGDLLALHDRAPGSGLAAEPDALDRVFTYDALRRLLSASGREADAPAPEVPWDTGPRPPDPGRVRPYVERYRYDPVGNLSSLEHARPAQGLDPAAPGFACAFSLVPGRNRLASMTTGSTRIDYAYDASGNVTQETTSRLFEWDHNDRLRGFRVQAGAGVPSLFAQYVYDATGERVKKLVRRTGGALETTVYVDGVFEHRRRVLGAAVEENNTVHVVDDRRRIALQRVGPPLSGDTAPAVTYPLGDHLDSATVVLDGEGRFVERLEYSPYGTTVFGRLAVERYRFTGKERDEETGLSYHGARYYAPWAARWFSCDPAGLEGGLSPYAYVNGDPLSLVDPTGRQGVSPSLRNFLDTLQSKYREAVRLAERVPGKTAQWVGTTADKAITSLFDRALREVGVSSVSGHNIDLHGAKARVSVDLKLHEWSKRLTQFRFHVEHMAKEGRILAYVTKEGWWAVNPGIRLTAQENAALDRAARALSRATVSLPSSTLAKVAGKIRGGAVGVLAAVGVSLLSGTANAADLIGDVVGSLLFGGVSKSIVSGRDEARMLREAKEEARRRLEEQRAEPPTVVVPEREIDPAREPPLGQIGRGR